MPENQSPQSLLDKVLALTGPLQLVFSIRKRTRQAKNRVSELQDRMERLEASIEDAKGKTHMGQRLNKLR